MIKITVQYNDCLRSIRFPCSEKELTSALTEIHAISDISELFVTEVKYPEELGFLKDRFVNPDELNYLAKRFDSFCESEEKQYFEAMKHESFTELPDLINLTFNLSRYTLIRDVRDMGRIGREYLMNRDGCIPAHDDDNPEYAEIGRKLIQSGEGICTDHGLLFVNEDIPFSEEYDGRVFPPYLYDTDVLFIARAEYRDRTEYLYMPCENEAITKAFGRLGAENPDDVNIIIEDFNVDNPDWFRRLCEIAEKESIYDINTLAGAVNNADIDLDKLTRAAEYVGVGDAASLASLAENLSMFTVFEGVRDYGDIGRCFVNNSHGYSVPPVLENFIYYENFGRHIAEEYNGKFVDGAFVCMKEGHSLDEVISEESQNIMNQQNDENEDQDESFGIQMM